MYKKKKNWAVKTFIKILIAHEIMEVKNIVFFSSILYTIFYHRKFYLVKTQNPNL